MSEDRKRKGLYERLPEERAEEERRRGRPLGPFYGVDSKVLDRRLGNAPSDRPGYRRDVYLLHEYIERGVRYLTGSLKGIEGLVDLFEPSSGGFLCG